MNHQPLIKASVQDVVEIQEFRTIGVPSKENGNKWEKEWCERKTVEQEIWERRDFGVKFQTFLHFQFT